MLVWIDTKMDFSSRLETKTISGPRSFDPSVPRLGWSIAEILKLRLAYPDSAIDSQKLLLGRLIYRLHLTPMGVRILARMMDDQIHLAPMVGDIAEGALYDPVTNSLCLDLEDSDGAIFAMMREARRARLMRLGLSTALDGYRPDTAILGPAVHFLILHRLIEADLDGHALMVAWQMSKQQDFGPWVYCQNLQELRPVIERLGHFDKDASDDPNIWLQIMNGWFNSERVHQCDRYMLDWLEWLVETYGQISAATAISSSRIMNILGYDDKKQANPNALWVMASDDFSHKVIEATIAGRLEILEKSIF